MPLVDMQPTDPNDFHKRFVMYKAPANGGGSDSNDGLSISTPIATFNEWWRRLMNYNLNGCWPQLYLLPTSGSSTHADSMDACSYPAGAPGWNTTNPGAGAGSFPNITGAWEGHPLGTNYAVLRDNCVVEGEPGKVAFSAIFDANYVCSWLTLDTPGRICFFPNERGTISGGNHRIKRCQYAISAVADGIYIGDGGLVIEGNMPNGSIGGLWLSSERGNIQMLQSVPIVFEGPVNFAGATAFVTNSGYLRVPVSFVNSSNVTGRKFLCQKGGGLDTFTGNPQGFMPGNLAGLTQQAGIPDGWAF